MGVEIIKHYYEVSEVAQLRHLALLSAGNEGEDLFGKGDQVITIPPARVRNPLERWDGS